MDHEREIISVRAKITDERKARRQVIIQSVKILEEKIKEYPDYLGVNAQMYVEDIKFLLKETS